MSITNKDSEVYNFYDSDITIWAGNSSNGGWTKLTTWNAKSFYDAAVKEYRTEVFLTAFAGALNTINTSMGSYSTSNVYTQYGSATVTTRTYNPGAVAASAYYAQASTESVKRSGKAYIDYLEENLMCSSSIRPGETYIGWVYFDVGRNDANYYKVELNNTNTRKKTVFIMKKTIN